MKARTLTKETIQNLAVIERNFPEFKAGDTITVSQRIKEGDKERIQLFQGDVISINNNGASSSFTVRKIGANNVPVERIFPYYSPLVDNIKIVKHGKVRRAKLYYVREKLGKAARLKEMVLTRAEKEEREDLAEQRKSESVAAVAV